MADLNITPGTFYARRNKAFWEVQVCPPDTPKDSDVGVGYPYNAHVAYVWGKNADTETSEAHAKANAHLFAGSKGLYAAVNALQGLLQLLASRDDSPFTMEDIQANHRWIEAEEALKKARGE